MSTFLYLVGVLVIIGGIAAPPIIGFYGLIICCALGCVNIGLGKIINILQEIKTDNPE